MQRAEIEKLIAARTPVAVKDGYSPQDVFPPSCVEGVVLETGVDRRVNWSDRRDGVRVRVEGRTPPERVVGSRDVVMLWPEYVRAMEARERARRERDEAEALLEERARAAVAVVGGLARFSGHGSATVKLSLEEAEQLGAERLTPAEARALLAQTGGMPEGMAVPPTRDMIDATASARAKLVRRASGGES